jgi:hypothetical protein
LRQKAESAGIAVLKTSPDPLCSPLAPRSVWEAGEHLWADTHRIREMVIAFFRFFRYLSAYDLNEYVFNMMQKSVRKINSTVHLLQLTEKSFVKLILCFSMLLKNDILLLVL